MLFTLPPPAGFELLPAIPASPPPPPPLGPVEGRDCGGGGDMAVDANSPPPGELLYEVARDGAPELATAAVSA